MTRTLLAILVLLALPAAPQRLDAQSPADDAEVLKALDAFLDGWNSRDAAKYAAALHFPHLILEAGQPRLFDDEAAFIAIGAKHWATVQPQWERSVWDDRRIVQRLGDTVHVAGRWARLDKAGQVISKADVLYVVVKKNGRWGIFARSGNRAAQRALGPAE